MPSAGLSQEVTVRPRMPSSSQIRRTCYIKSGIGSSNWNVSMVVILPRKPLWVYCPGHAGVKGNDGADRQSNHHRWLASRKICCVEELETLPAGTSQRQHTIDRLEERGVESGSVLHGPLLIRLIREGRMEMGEEGGREIMYLSLRCHYQNDSCSKMGSDESHFSVS